MQILTGSALPDLIGIFIENELNVQIEQRNAFPSQEPDTSHLFVHLLSLMLFPVTVYLAVECILELLGTTL